MTDTIIWGVTIEAQPDVVSAVLHGLNVGEVCRLDAGLGVRRQDLHVGRRQSCACKLVTADARRELACYMTTRGPEPVSTRSSLPNISIAGNVSQHLPPIHCCHTSVSTCSLVDAQLQLF